MNQISLTVFNLLPQTLLQSGQRPTVVQQLCSLPFEYFSDARLKSVLFPTLIASCFMNSDNVTILKQDLSTLMLATFIDDTIVQSNIEQIKRREIRNNIGESGYCI